MVNAECALVNGKLRTVFSCQLSVVSCQLSVNSVSLWQVALGICFNNINVRCRG